MQGGEYSYRIDRVLGQGSFGITYLAYAKVTIGGKLGKLQGEMPVAVKEFFMRDINGREGSTVTLGSEGGLFDKYKHKFSREARNLAALDHPGIVKVLETFESNGTSYYSMEYCGGGSLDALIAGRGCLPQDEALKYFGQMADALGYMHGRHMLHLDMKPGNVMLRTSGEAVLIDFGLSKQYDDDGVPESSTTIGGGTPGYAPIEQTNYKEGDGSGHLPVTMDIYALGATLYKMLTGERPPVASDVLVNFPEKPLRDHGVSDNVVAALRRAMQPIPANRYQSVAAFAEALHCSINEPTEPVPQAEVIALKKSQQPLRPKPASKPQGNSKGKVLTLTAVAIAALVILIAFMPMYKTSEPDASAQYAGTDAMAEVAVAENNTNGALEQAVIDSSTEPVPSDTVVISTLTENNTQRQNVQPNIESNKHETIVYTPNAENASQEQLSPEELFQKGKKYHDEDNYTEAVKWYSEAAEQGYAKAQYNLGYCYDEGLGVSQNYAEAVKWYRKAAEQGLADAQNNLGVCYAKGQGVGKNYVEAAKWYRKAAEQGDAVAQHNLARGYDKGYGVSQDYAEAMKWYRKAAEQGYDRAQFDLGVCYYLGNGVSRDFAEAIKWYRKAAEQGNADAHCLVGDCYYFGYGVNQDIDEAVKWYRKAAERGHDRAKERLKILGY